MNAVSNCNSRTQQTEMYANRTTEKQNIKNMAMKAAIHQYLYSSIYVCMIINIYVIA